MAELNLTQQEADTLIAMEKVCLNTESQFFPSFGGSISIPLISSDKRENFILDIWRSQINLSKGKYQSRARQAVILVRLDFGGQPHRNPDDEEIPSPHLHIYREEYGDKWAFPVPIDKFPRINDAWNTLLDFYRYCNIVQPPNIIQGIFT
jgi:hypothetical protein